MASMVPKEEEVLASVSPEGSPAGRPLEKIDDSSAVGTSQNSTEQAADEGQLLPASKRVNKILTAALKDDTRGRGDVSALAYRLISLEIVRYFDSRGEYGKLEQLGCSIGHKFAERYARNNAKYASTLDVIKFMCKDLWSAMFGKYVDKLQTNHKGVYVLHDNNFAWMANVDIDYDDAAAVDEAKKFLIVPCGLVRGALSNLGVKCVVRAEFSSLPMCLFNVQVLEELLGS